jgi:hypothetical protein
MRRLVVEQDDALIEWWNTLDLYALQKDAQELLERARESKHPDAQWLAALFPADVAVTRERVAEVMRAQGDDARALFFVWRMEDTAGGEAEDMLVRAAAMGYAVAQAHASACAAQGFRQLSDSAREEGDDGLRLRWAQRAAAQGDRYGTYLLGVYFRDGKGCGRNYKKANEQFRIAAEWGHTDAQFSYGLSFDVLDWRRYFWWGCAGSGYDYAYRTYVLGFLASFEKGEHGRPMATVLERDFEDATARYRSTITDTEWEQLLRVMHLHKAMLGRAWRAIGCWSVTGRRLGVAKDVRIIIAKMAWEDVWRWDGKERVKGAE